MVISDPDGTFPRAGASTAWGGLHRTDANKVSRQRFNARVLSARFHKWFVAQ